MTGKMALEHRARRRDYGFDADRAEVHESLAGVAVVRTEDERAETVVRDPARAADRQA